MPKSINFTVFINLIKTKIRHVLIKDFTIFFFKFFIILEI